MELFFGKDINEVLSELNGKFFEELGSVSEENLASLCNNEIEAEVKSIIANLPGYQINFNKEICKKDFFNEEDISRST